MKDPIQPERIDLLAKKWQDGTISQQERKEFEAWYAEFDDQLVEVEASETIEQAELRYYRQIAARAGIRPAKPSVLWPRIASIAAAVVFMVFGVYFFRGNKAPVPAAEVASAFGGDVAPGKNSAVLTLASGKQIVLSESKSGVVVGSGSEIAYEDGSAVLPAGAAGSGAELATISTPAGGKYDITLPDGTKVALNAASTLSFPSSFLGLVNRKVELRGEGYFAVAKDKHHPFIVQTASQRVEVLGTHFNVNAYTDEPATVTTLEEGSVKVSADGDLSAKLVPGEQSSFSVGAIKVSAADLEENLAWKNGDFVFNDEPIEDVLRKVARWYDVEVVYEDGVPSGTFYAKVSRTKNISQVLRALELTKLVHFKVEGRRILVRR